jgi:hydrogenase-4 membrane subunit HyfE
VIGVVAWACAALGLAVPVVRRRSVAVAAVTAQTLVLAAGALASADAGVAPALALLVRGLLLGTLLIAVIARTREARPVHTDAGPLVRAAAAVVAGLALAVLVPSLGLVSRDAERAVLALVAFALVAVALRRTTLHQLVAVVLLENALALAALAAPGGLPSLVELGVAADIVVVVLVGVVLHARIHAEFGSGDVAHLGSLRD